VAWWWRKRRDAEQVAAAQQPMSERLLEVMLTHQTQQTESLAKLLDTVAEAAARNAARALGVRRANTAKRAPDGKFLPNPKRPTAGACRVCADPGSLHLTADEIEAHYAHGANGKGA